VGSLSEAEMPPVSPPRGVTTMPSLIKIQKAIAEDIEHPKKLL
jgi:hypothetical protein